MQRTSVQVLSVHDAKDAILAFDLKDILGVLGKRLKDFTWCVIGLDCHGGVSEAVCKKVEESVPFGNWMSSEELLEFSKGITQIIEGSFLAFPKDIGKKSIGQEDLDLGEFPSSRAELAIVAVDGSWFDIYTKDPTIGEIIRKNFRDVRDQNAVDFFGKVGG